MSETTGTVDPDEAITVQVCTCPTDSDDVPAAGHDDECPIQGGAYFPEGEEPHQEPAGVLEVAARTGAVGSAIPDLPVIPPGSEMHNLAQIANTLAMADAVPKALRRKPNDVFLVLLTARDTGVALTTAMREFHVIEGTVTLSPKVKLAMVRQAGIGHIWPARQNNAEGATWHAYRMSHPDQIQEVSFTWEDAQMAGLVDTRCTPTNHWTGSNQKCMCKDNWRRYPQRMVSWRALGYLLDDLFPEVATGLYSPDELGAVTDSEGQPLEVTAVEALPGMRGGRSDAPPEEQASDEAKAEVTARIGRLVYEAREDCKAWWMAEGIPKLDQLPARLLPKVKAKLSWFESQPGALEQTGEAEPAGEPSGDDAPTPPPAEPQESPQTPDPEPLDDPAAMLVDGDPAHWVIARARQATPAQLRADFRAAGLKPPEGGPNPTREAWGRWTLARLAAGLLELLSGGAILEDDAAEAFAELSA